MHNVRLDQIEATAKAAADDPSAAKLEADLDGGWRVDEEGPQFAGIVKFPKGETLFEADFPPFLGEEGRAPTPLAYRFYGAMCCYGATFATQAAMAGVHLKSLQISLSVDYRAALGRCRTQWHTRPRPESCRGGARLTSL
jgi:hypothetical protein